MAGVGEGERWTGQNFLTQGVAVCQGPPPPPPWHSYPPLSAPFNDPRHQHSARGCQADGACASDSLPLVTGGVYRRHASPLHTSCLEPCDFPIHIRVAERGGDYREGAGAAQSPTPPPFRREGNVAARRDLAPPPPLPALWGSCRRRRRPRQPWRRGTEEAPEAAAPPGAGGDAERAPLCARLSVAAADLRRRPRPPGQPRAQASAGHELGPPPWSEVSAGRAGVGNGGASRARCGAAAGAARSTLGGRRGRRPAGARAGERAAGGAGGGRCRRQRTWCWVVLGKQLFLFSAALCGGFSLFLGAGASLRSFSFPDRDLGLGRLLICDSGVESLGAGFSGWLPWPRRFQEGGCKVAGAQEGREVPGRRALVQQGP